MMKNTLITLAIVFFANLVSAGDKNAMLNQNNSDGNSSNQMAINANDTVVFDLTQAVYNGSTVEFPVYFLSDDTVNTLDFSFRYNQVNFTFDSIINLMPNLQTLSNYNSNDSTVMFTSYSLQSISNNTPLVSVRFRNVSSLLCRSDFNSINVYLNGDVCTEKINNCSSVGLPGMNDQIQGISIYPNPASEHLYVRVSERSTIQLLDINSSEVVLQRCAYPDQLLEIDTQQLSNGIFLIRIYNEHFIVVKKAIISK